jgi:hypothetical protein
MPGVAALLVLVVDDDVGELEYDASEAVVGFEAEESGMAKCESLLE